MLNLIHAVWHDDKVTALMLLPFALLLVAGTAAVLTIPVLYILNGGHPVIIP